MADSTISDMRPLPDLLMTLGTFGGYRPTSPQLAQLIIECCKSGFFRAADAAQIAQAASQAARP
jgi:hypothetical protein